MKVPSSLVKACFPAQPPKCLISYLEHVAGLEYDETPNYTLLRQLFRKELALMKCDDKPNVLDWVSKAAKACYRGHIFIFVFTLIVCISASCN